MGLIKCPECGKEISDMAQSCPNCGRPLQQNANVQSANGGQQMYQQNPVPPKPPKKKGHGCLITILSFIIFIGIIIAAVIGGLGQNKLIQREVSGVSDDSEYITMEEYNAIESGMSYETVKEIVGSDGEISSQVEMNGIKVVIVTWYGNGVAGSNANVTFTNNEVTGKAQVGLK